MARSCYHEASGIMDNTKKPMSQRTPLPACSFSPNNAAVNKIASVDATIPGVHRFVKYLRAVI